VVDLSKIRLEVVMMRLFSRRRFPWFTTGGIQSFSHEGLCVGRFRGFSVVWW